MTSTSSVVSVLASIWRVAEETPWGGLAGEAVLENMRAAVILLVVAIVTMGASYHQPVPAVSETWVRP